MNNKFILNEKYHKIQKLYEEGYKITEIAKKCNCSQSLIFYALKMLQFKPNRGYKRGILISVKKNVINDYMNNHSINFISNKYKLTTFQIKNILLAANIDFISAAKRYNKNLNEDYFSEIDSPIKAYWLGWLITDGCVSKGNNIALTLQARDKDILFLFEKDLGLENHVKVFNKKYYRLSFCCKKMAQDLAKYGIVKNKTFTVTIPEMREKYIPYLLRGCFEGDGGISSTLRKNRYEYELAFTGNWNCVNKFNELLSRLIDCKPKKIKKNHAIWRVRWSSIKEIKVIFNKLYNDELEHILLRKYEKLRFLEKQ